MDNIVYEKDYRRPAEERIKNDWASQVFDRAVYGTALKDYADAMNKIPKIIVPKDKENYEYLLERCDKIAARLHGYIKGEVDYQRWYSYIELLLPYAEFGSAEERAFLKEVSERAHLVTFTATEDGGIRLSLMINYFEELMTEEHKGYLRYDAIMNDPELASLLNMPSLSPEETEITERLNAILDRFEEETEYDRTTVFKALLDRMSKVDEDAQTIETMLLFAEKLLELALEQESDELEQE